MAIGFDTREVWQARGRGFQMGVIQPEGRVIHLTGQVAWSADETIIGKGDVATQTHQIFKNISKLLQLVGGDLADIVAMTSYLTHRDHLPAVQAVRTSYFSAGAEPASTTIIVAGLGHEDFLVELTPIAVVPQPSVGV